MTPALFGENDNNLKVTHFVPGHPNFLNFNIGQMEINRT